MSSRAKVLVNWIIIMMSISTINGRCSKTHRLCRYSNVIFLSNIPDTKICLAYNGWTTWWVGLHVELVYAQARCQELGKDLQEVLRLCVKKNMEWCEIEGLHENQPTITFFQPTITFSSTYWNTTRAKLSMDEITRPWNSSILYAATFLLRVYNCETTRNWNA